MVDREAVKSGIWGLRRAVLRGESIYLGEEHPLNPMRETMWGLVWREDWEEIFNGTRTAQTDSEDS